MKFIALTLVFAFLLSGCSTKKNRQEWNSYNENEEWSYFMPEDVDSLQDALNDEITQLENKRYEHEGIIEQLKMVLNDLDNWLTKLLN